MMKDVKICKRLKEEFLKIIAKHGNGRWATNELEWLTFDKNKDEFYNLDNESQWEIRDFMISLRGIYGYKQEGEL